MARAERTLVTRETRSRLVDKRGLAKDSAPVVSRVDKQDVAFEQRRRLLSFWRLSSTGSATLHMHERTSCHGDFLAVDASQSLLHMRALETPMGSYPRATVRASDVTFVQFHSRWRISPALPVLPRSLLRRCSTDTQVGSSSVGVHEAAGSEDHGADCVPSASTAWNPRSEETQKCDISSPVTSIHSPPNRPSHPTPAAATTLQQQGQHHVALASAQILGPALHAI